MIELTRYIVEAPVTHVSVIYAVRGLKFLPRLGKTANQNDRDAATPSKPRKPATKADEEVFDGGVGRNDAYRIAQVSWSFVDSRPTAKTKPQFSYLFL